MHEESLSADDILKVADAYEEGVKFYKHPDAGSNESLLGHIDRTIDTLQGRPPSEQDISTIAGLLGGLWGGILCKEFQFQWCRLEGDPAGAARVAAPDRAVCLMPQQFIEECLRHPEIDFTAMLMFNMLRANQIASKANSWADLAINTIRIIPKPGRKPYRDFLIGAGRL